MAVPFVRWLLPTTWKTGAKFSGKGEGSSAWLMVTRRRTGARKHHGATVICVAEFTACTRPFDLSVPMRSMLNGLGKLARQVVRKARQADHLESSPIGLFGRATERVLRARGAHLAENAARGPRCEVRILGVLGQFVMEDSLTCGFSSWQEREPFPIWSSGLRIPWRMRPPSDVFCQTGAFSLQSGPPLAFSAMGKREGRERRGAWGAKDAKDEGSGARKPGKVGARIEGA